MSQQFQGDGGGGQDDPIDLSRLTPRRRERARLIMREIADGRPYTEFHGKRMKHDRSRISVPLGKHWRLVFEEVDGKPEPRACMSHSDYNGRKPGRRRRGKQRKNMQGRSPDGVG